MKPDKFGIKVWLLADSDSYYIPRFKIYLGKSRHNCELFQQKGLGFYVVWSLGEPYLDSNRHFFFDNFFTSVDLMKCLAERKTYACRTCRANRKGFPQDLKKLKLVAGEVRTPQDGNLVATVWRDKREVSFLSTNVQLQVPIHAVQQNAGRLKRIVPEEMLVKPEVVAVYNSGMNGVDVSDQYRSYYPTGGPSQKWWKYLLWFFVNLAIVNAFLLEKHTGRSRCQRQFRIELAKQLIAGFNGYKRPGNNGSKRSVSSVVVGGVNVRGHQMLRVCERKKACAMCAKVGRKRSDRRTHETCFACLQCGVPLCRKMRGDHSCFVEWHSGNT